MRIVIGNTTSKIVFGGKDNLVKCNFTKEIRGYLRVRSKGYAYAKAYKENRWDGFRYFITKNHEFLTGFFPMVKMFLEEFGYEIEVQDERAALPQFNEEWDDFIGEIDGESWHGREYQMVAAKKIMNQEGGIYFPRGIWNAATNFGKNSLAALVVKNMKEPYPTIFMVSEQGIYQQAVEFFSQSLGYEVGEVCSTIRGFRSKAKHDVKPFTVCMVKTLLSRAKKQLNVRAWLQKVEVLIVDESDESGAKEYSKCLTYINAGVRMFVSGTAVDASKENTFVSIGLSGKVLAKVSNKDLIDMGYSQKPTVKMILNDSGWSMPKSYQAELEKNIHKSRNRAKLVAELINKHSDVDILVTFNITEHGRFMLDYLRESFPDVDAELVYSESDDRVGIIERFKQGKVSVLFASMIFKRGQNASNIRVMIRTEGGKSVTTGKQIVGRGLRHDGKNDDVLIYDFWDTGKYISKHSRARIKLYKNEGFDVEITYQHKRYSPI